MVVGSMSEYFRRGIQEPELVKLFTALIHDLKR